MNTLITIGNTGSLTCYLNISLDEAAKRYIDSSEYTKSFRLKYPKLSDVDIINDHLGNIETGVFNDEFKAYAVYL